MSTDNFSTDLIIIGGGAAGLMAGVAAGEAGIRAMILERKSKPGRKLLLCGNSRCNLTTNISEERKLQFFGEPMSTFLSKAIREFSPSILQRWFASNGLKTVVKTGNKVYPHTERATDVLNLFTDKLREYEVPLCVSAPVTQINTFGKGYCIHTANFSITTRFIIIATGGVSYPNSGSVGDGQNFAKDFGHSVEPYHPGLVGYDVDERVIKGRIGEEFDKVRCKLISDGKEITETRGVYKIEKWGIGGTAITNTSRYVSRLKLTNYTLEIIFENGRIEKVKPLNLRPIKEAQVTVGGVSLDQINNQNMESQKSRGLYFAGEVMDVDGPTGGYNLNASFASARLAVSDIAGKLGKKIPVIVAPEKKKKGNHKPHDRSVPHKKKKYYSKKR